MAAAATVGIGYIIAQIRNFLKNAKKQESVKPHEENLESSENTPPKSMQIGQ